MAFIFDYFNKATILVYGADGWIGGMFVKYLRENRYNVIIGGSRVDKIYELRKEIVAIKPTHVISFIGRTHGTIDGTPVNSVDYLEYPGKIYENVRDNLYCPIVLANICLDLDIHYTYLGTGCIFNGDTGVNRYAESDLPDFFGSGYSVVKGFTDRLMQDIYSECVLNIRIRMPISSIPNSRNFITKIAGYPKICNQPNSMTVLDDFFPIFIDLMTKKATGTWNCTNPGTISHNEILCDYCKYIDPSHTWINISLEEQSMIIKGQRSNNELDTTKIQKMYPQLKNISESVTCILKKMNKK